MTWINEAYGSTVATTQIVGGTFVKEWSELTDSVIIVVPPIWSSSVKDGERRLDFQFWWHS